MVVDRLAVEAEAAADTMAATACESWALEKPCSLTVVSCSGRCACLKASADPEDPAGLVGGLMDGSHRHRGQCLEAVRRDNEGESSLHWGRWQQGTGSRLDLRNLAREP